MAHNPFDDFTGDDGTPGRGAPARSPFDPFEDNPITNADADTNVNTDTSQNADGDQTGGADSAALADGDGDTPTGDGDGDGNAPGTQGTAMPADVPMPDNIGQGEDNAQPMVGPNLNDFFNQVSSSTPGGAVMSIRIPSPDDDAEPYDAVKQMMVNYNEKFVDADPTLFRDEVVQQTLSVLVSRTKPNPLLIGAAGVGKTAVVEEIARRIATGDPSIPEQLQDTTIYELPISAITADASLAGEMEKRVQQIIAFASDPEQNVIIFMDEMHQLLDSRSAMISKAAQMFKPPMARGDVRIIGATTLQESKTIDKDPAFSRRMTRIGVDELTIEQTRVILNACAKHEVEHFAHTIAIPADALDACISHADAYLSTANNRPDNAITLLSRAAADLYLLSAPIRQKVGDVAVPMSTQHVASVAERLASGNAEPNHFDEAELAANLSRIKGQNHVTKELPGMLKRRALRLTKRNRPLVMMFAGPSGVGKTEIANIIAEHLTGTAPIRINGGEYASGFSTSALLGSPKGYVGSEDNDEMPFDKLRTNPQQVILIDEVDKMSKEVWQLFLSAFDAGTMKMADHTEIDFSQAVVILTTNAGKKLFTSNPMGFTVNNEATDLTSDSAHNRALLTGALTQPKGPFSTEFIGRMQFIAGFNPIQRDTYATIVEEAYERERGEVISLHPNYAVCLPETLPDDVVEEIVSHTYHVDHGARPARQAVTAEIEDRVLAFLDEKVTLVPTTPTNHPPTRSSAEANLFATTIAEVGDARADRGARK